MQKYTPAHFADLADTERGRKLWRFLNRDDNVLRMQTASDLRRPALEPLGALLVKEFDDTIREDRWKQMLGHMTRQILEASGYRLDQQGVRLRDNPLFTSASRYRREG
jgi:hypothetical protein